MSGLHVSRITVKNILGIEALSIAPGQVTVIEGGNGAGKTSVLEALKAIVQGGHDATLLRHGESTGLVALVLDDDTVVEKVVESDKSRLVVEDATLGRVTAPKTFVDAITTLAAINPLRFCAAGAEERKKQVLRSLDVAVTGEEVEAIVRAVPGLDSTRVGVRGFAAIQFGEKQLIAARAKASTGRDEQISTAEQLERSFTSSSSTAQVKAEIDAAERKLAALVAESYSLERDLAANRARSVDEAVREALAPIRAEQAAKEDEQNRMSARLDIIFAKRQAALRNLKKSYDDAVARVEEEHKKEVQAESVLESRLSAEAKALKSRAEDVADKVKAEKTAWLLTEAEAAMKVGRDAIETAKLDLATLRERLAATERETAAREIAAKARKAAEQHEERHSAIVAALERISEIKDRALERLPVEGLVVGDEDLEWKGRTFERLSEAEKIEVAFRLAVAAMGKLRLICVDGLESLDADRLADLERLARDHDVQLVGTRVTSGPLKVTTT